MNDRPAQMGLFVDYAEIVELMQAHRGSEFEALCDLARQVVSERGEVCADDLRAYGVTGDLRIIGATLGHLKVRGELEEDGYMRTAIPTSHGRPIIRYRPGPRLARLAS